jgi:hypothetical protein
MSQTDDLTWHMGPHREYDIEYVHSKTPTTKLVKYNIYVHPG